MAIKATLRLEGGKELERKLKTLPTRVRNKVVRTALRSGAKIVHTEQKSASPERKGKLKKDVKVRAAKRKRGRIAVNVQIGKDIPYESYVVLGHRLGKGKHGKDDTRRLIEGNNFPLEAFNRKAPQAAQVIEQQLKTGIEAEASK